jgi:hypothetical protein
MKAVYRTDGRPGGFITASIVPANRTEMSRFGGLDAVIAVVVVFLLVGTATVLRFALAG